LRYNLTRVETWHSASVKKGGLVISTSPLLLSQLYTLISASVRLGAFTRLGAKRLSTRARHTPRVLSRRSHLHWELVEWRLSP
jgi:hypothetical protein